VNACVSPGRALYGLSFMAAAGFGGRQPAAFAHRNVKRPDVIASATRSQGVACRPVADLLNGGHLFCISQGSCKPVPQIYTSSV
jgi:hypothetical protein